MKPLHTDDGRKRQREFMATAPADCDLSVFTICRAHGHSLEGRVITLEPGELRLLGRCQRCGLGIMADH